MRRFSYKPYAWLAALLIVMISMPYTAAEKIRSCAVAAVGPSWRMVNFLKESFFKITTILPSGGFQTPPSITRELEVLRHENHSLRSQIELLRQYLVSEQLLQQQIEQLKKFNLEDPFFYRRASELVRLIELQAHAISGKVVFREPASWSSSLWINIGERNNQLVGKTIIAKNSPVIVGTSVVGIIEYVGHSRSRVRLITDSGLVPAVRVLRGAEQNRVLLEQIKTVLASLEARSDLGGSKEAAQVLKLLENSLGEEKATLYLAKGELYGSSFPLWRSRGYHLHGVGFNYDFADEEGPQRNLKTGEPINALGMGQSIELVKAGDILVTTGMDGVFPANLRVAQVTAVHPLREGACSFDLEAKALISDLDNLAFVTVLPPMEPP